MYQCEKHEIPYPPDSMEDANSSEEINDFALIFWNSSKLVNHISLVDQVGLWDMFDLEKLCNFREFVNIHINVLHTSLEVSGITFNHWLKLLAWSTPVSTCL